MVDHKVKGLKILYPLSKPWIKLVLALNELERLMIRMEDELPSQQVVSPMLQSPSNCIKLLVISLVFALGIIEFLTKVSKGLSFLS